MKAPEGTFPYQPLRARDGDNLPWVQLPSGFSSLRPFARAFAGLRRHRLGFRTLDAEVPGARRNEQRLALLHMARQRLRHPVQERMPQTLIRCCYCSPVDLCDVPLLFMLPLLKLCHSHPVLLVMVRHWSPFIFNDPRTQKTPCEVTSCFHDASESCLTGFEEVKLNRLLVLQPFAFVHDGGEKVVVQRQPLDHAPVHDEAPTLEARGELVLGALETAPGAKLAPQGAGAGGEPPRGDALLVQPARHCGT